MSDCKICAGNVLRKECDVMAEIVVIGQVRVTRLAIKSEFELTDR